MTRVKAMVRTRIPEQCYQNNLKRLLSNYNVQLKIKSSYEFLNFNIYGTFWQIDIALM